MEIIIDLSAIGTGGVVNPLVMLWFILKSGGWIVLVPVLAWGLFMVRLRNVQLRYDAAQKYILLAVDVPKENEQTPKAVEQVFAHLHGIQKKGNIKERLIDGYSQPALSLELVSIEGYVQYFIRTPEKFRDLVEAAFYAQYPNAEITEVEDYTEPFRVQFPNEEYDIWGTELRMTNKQFYPIRTYPSFEHPLSQTFLDPMANILEIFSRLGRGEQIWLQILIAPPPPDNKWREEGIRLVKRLIGARTVSPAPGLATFPATIARGVYETAVASLFPPTTAAEQREEQRWPTLMQHLPPHERTVVEQVGIKISKIAYQSKIRLLYVAKHDVFNKDRPPALLGAIKQFNSLDMNGLIIDHKTKTKLDFFFVNYRQNARKRRLMRGYKFRSIARGRRRYIFNIEELATLFHFPVTTVVKAPRVQKTESKRGEPPAALPVEAEFRRVQPFAPGAPSTPQPEAIPPAPFATPEIAKRTEAPPNLPI